MHRPRVLSLLAALLFLSCLVFPTTSFAQTTADIVGRVTDSSGAVLPGATVVVPSVLVICKSAVETTGLTVSSGTYSFTPAAGASLHGAELQTATGERRWSITIFDGSTSFTLPGLSPDPLPAGGLLFEASALKIPGVDVGNFKLDDVRDKIAGIAKDFVTFTH